MVQGELFRDDNLGAHLRSSDFGAQNSFLRRYQLSLTLDKLILALMGILVIFVLTYSFGVERGKRAMEKRIEPLLLKGSDTILGDQTSAQAPANGQTETVLIVNEGKAAPTSSSLMAEPRTASVEVQVSTPKIQSTLPVPDLSRKAKYTIQLVTYKDEQQAAKEIERLQAKGFEGFVIPSGPYFQVCAHYAETKSKAQSFLNEFLREGRYPDAYVRPIVR